MQNFFDQKLNRTIRYHSSLDERFRDYRKTGKSPGFLSPPKEVLARDGQLLLDSSDLSYLFEDEDGNLDIAPEDDYFGEIDFRMQYKSIKGDSFDWLYIDFNTLNLYARQAGFKAEKIEEGEHYDYLARITHL